MARLLPSTPDTSAADEAAPRVIGIEGEDADDLLSALSSSTARQLLSALHAEPAAPSEIAERVDTSLQNAQYHLDKLEEAGLVEVIDTVYSEKGREMRVYAPADRPLVVVAGDEEERSSLQTALASLLGGVGLLAVAGFVVGRLVGSGGDAATGAGDGGGVSALDVGTPTPTSGGGGLLPLAGIADLATSPGGLFFLGGLAVLLVGVAVWYARNG